MPVVCAQAIPFQDVNTAGAKQCLLPKNDIRHLLLGNAADAEPRLTTDRAMMATSFDRTTDLIGPRAW
jgi:hypothetical protein